MRAFHLSVLGLNIDASEQGIKSAYRELTKKYHPDINDAPEATAKFIEIKASYDYLTQKPQEPTYDEPAVSDDLTNREQWRMDARKRAREKAIAQQKYQQELIVKLNGYIRPFVVLILVLNALITVDYYLPTETHDQAIVSVARVYENNSSSRYTRKRQYRYDEIEFEKFTMTFDRGEVVSLALSPNAKVHTTPLFNIPMAATLFVNELPENYQQLYNIFFVFGYLIPVIIILCLLFFYLKKPTHRLNMGIILAVFSVIQLVVVFSY